jgi:hypothetical protein
MNNVALCSGRRRRVRNDSRRETIWGKQVALFIGRGESIAFLLPFKIQSLPQKKYHLSITKISLLMLFKEITSVYCQ